MFQPLVPLVLSILFAMIAPAPAKPALGATSGAQGPSVSVPAYPNASCPIMGKPISTKLFTDTEKGRIYICCKSCSQDILDDVELAYRTAYPATRKLGNTTCPITAKKIEQESVAVEIQGVEFSLCCKDCVGKARERTQVLLAKANDAKLVDLENKLCPMTGEPTLQNTFVVIDGTIVRLSSARLVDEVSKDPAAVLAKARALRAKQAKENGAKSSGDVEPR